MSEAKIHTPYDGGSKLFQIGLKPLDLTAWIDVDHKLRTYLDEKDRVAHLFPQEIFAAEPETLGSQSEILHLLADHLPKQFPHVYQRLGPQIDILPAFRRVRLDAPFLPPLLIAAGLVQEDLVLMRKGPEGWKVAAGALAFPSSWRLREKLGLPMHQVHGPVPGFTEGTRNAGLIERMFDNLRSDMPVIRWNWSLYGDDVLHHPESGNPKARRFGDTETAESVFFRVERQTLRRLAVSGDILFTIRIYIDPIATLEKQPNAAAIARSLMEQITALSDAELDYKGLTVERDRLLARLARIT